MSTVCARCGDASAGAYGVIGGEVICDRCCMKMLMAESTTEDEEDEDPDDDVPVHLLREMARQTPQSARPPAPYDGRFLACYDADCTHGGPRPSASKGRARESMLLGHHYNKVGAAGVEPAAALRLLRDAAEAVDPLCERIMDACALDALADGDVGNAADFFVVARLIGAAVDSAGSEAAFSAALRSKSFISATSGLLRKPDPAWALVRDRLDAHARGIDCACLGRGAKRAATQKPWAAQRLIGAKHREARRWREARGAFDAAWALLDAEAQKHGAAGFFGGWLQWLRIEQASLRCEASRCCMQLGLFKAARRLAAAATGTWPYAAAGWACAAAAHAHAGDLSGAAWAYERAFREAQREAAADFEMPEAVANYADQAQRARARADQARAQAEADAAAAKASAAAAAAPRPPATAPLLVLFRQHEWLREAVLARLSREDVGRASSAATCLRDVAPRALRVIACARLRAAAHSRPTVLEAVAAYVDGGDAAALPAAALAAIVAARRKRRLVADKDCARALAAACPRDYGGAVVFVRVFAAAVSKADAAVKGHGWAEFVIEQAHPTNLRCIFISACLRAPYDLELREIRQTALGEVEEILRKDCDDDENESENDDDPCDHYDDDDAALSAPGLAAIVRADVFFELMDRVAANVLIDVPGADWGDALTAARAEEEQVIFCALHNIFRRLQGAYDADRTKSAALGPDFSKAQTILGSLCRCTAMYYEAGLGFLDWGRGISDAEAQRWRTGLSALAASGLSAADSPTLALHVALCIALVQQTLLGAGALSQNHDDLDTRKKGHQGSLDCVQGQVVVIHLCELCLRRGARAYARDLREKPETIHDFLRGCLRIDRALRRGVPRLHQYSERMMRQNLGGPAYLDLLFTKPGRRKHRPRGDARRGSKNTPPEEAPPGVRLKQAR